MLQVQKLLVRHGAYTAVDGLDLSLQAGEIGCLLGASGCGKTTVLRAIAGLCAPSGGQIFIDGKQMHGTPAHARGVGLVFQDHALFAHLSALDNVAFAIRNQDKYTEAKKMLALVELLPEKDKKPHQLSGGQAQRVALARALAMRPKILLLDEPFSSLDYRLRGELASAVRTILKNTGTTALMVTHDQNEAFAISDKIGVMADGRLLQFDTPENLYHTPKHRTVAEFIGQGSLLHAHNGCCALGMLDCKDCDSVLLRPHQISMSDGCGNMGCSATVQARIFLGAHYRYELVLHNGERLLCIDTRRFDEGAKVCVGADLTKAVGV